MFFITGNVHLQFKRYNEDRFLIYAENAYKKYF